MPYKLNYDDLFILDSEDLAEAGIARAYEKLLPLLQKYVKHPSQIEELLDNDVPSYSVRYGTMKFAIYGPELGEECDSWGRATFAFFAIVNDQLRNASHLFYAINGGNDLNGIFLTPDQAIEAQKTLPNKQDWPYLPKDDAPWYGMYH